MVRRLHIALNILIFRDIYTPLMTKASIARANSAWEENLDGEEGQRPGV